MPLTLRTWRPSVLSVCPFVCNIGGSWSDCGGLSSVKFSTCFSQKQMWWITATRVKTVHTAALRGPLHYTPTFRCNHQTDWKKWRRSSYARTDTHDRRYGCCVRVCFTLYALRCVALPCCTARHCIRTRCERTRGGSKGKGVCPPSNEIFGKCNRTSGMKI